MHGFDELKGSDEPVGQDSRPWYAELNRYHVFVLIVAALGWLFDCLDQQLFILARPAAMKELLKGSSELDITAYGYYATSIFLVGWAMGGLIFGVLGDRIGRAKTMMITILMYSAFTGLSALSMGFWDFAFYRFLTGLGVGGEFAVGVALVAEVMPARARPRCLSLLQALSAGGNISAALINAGLGLADEEKGLPFSPWRIMFLIGAVPALLALLIRRRLKEPDTWKRAKSSGSVTQKLGSYGELFRSPTLRKHALLGLVLSSSGVIGLWAVGFFAPDLTKVVQRKATVSAVLKEFQAAAPAAKDASEERDIDRLAALMVKPDAKIPADLQTLKADVERVVGGRQTRLQSLTSIMTNVGAFLGMFGFGVLSERIGRKPTFAMAFIAAFLSTAAVFWFLDGIWTILILVPIMGFCQLSLFAGYAMYFPELFPTYLRSTGTSFCYNVGRFIAAIGPIIQAQLVYAYATGGVSQTPVSALRYAGVTMCGVFLIGLLALPFLPETRGKPLPE